MHVSVLAAYLRLLAKYGHIEKMTTIWERFVPNVTLNDNMAFQSMLNTCADLKEAGLSLGREVETLPQKKEKSNDFISVAQICSYHRK